MLSPEDALQKLLKSLPRCCNCQNAYATVIDAYRWPLCETCWRAVPGSDSEQPATDMREAVSAANLTLRVSLANSLARVPSYHEIPPPPSNPPEANTDLEELEYRNKRLRAKIRHMREQRVSTARQIGVLAFAFGFTFAALLSAVLHYL